MTNKTLSIALVSLGCPKNLVDSENMSGIMQQEGWIMVNDPGQADVIVVNTCGFIESAVKEAIDTILAMADYKTAGSCDYLIVTGCMTQRYHRHVVESLPEVDAILGTRSYAEIADVIRTLYDRDSADAAAGGLGHEEAIIRRSTDPDGVLAHLHTDHPVSTGGFAYLKIAEGCDNKCAYCAIPGIRGRLRSRPIADLVEEARHMIEKGATEIIIVGQDTTSYGRDLDGQRHFAELLRQLVELPGLDYLRFLYAYADGMTDELLDLIAEKPKILPYIDLPIQHASDHVLKRMRRTDTEAYLRETFGRIRKKLPNAILRTTVMVGFPGETEEDFEILSRFVQDMRFDYLGCFIFSPEEGTAAYQMEDRVAPEVAQERYDRIMSIQQPITAEKNQAMIGQTRSVLIEGIADDGIFYTGRTPEQAPDVDTITYVVADCELEIGKRYPVRIVEAHEYELTGTHLESVDDETRS